MKKRLIQLAAGTLSALMLFTITACSSNPAGGQTQDGGGEAETYHLKFALDETQNST